MKRGSPRPAAPTVRVAPRLSSVLGLALLAVAPLVAYAWVAVDADVVMRIGMARERNVSAARLVAGRLDAEIGAVDAAVSRIAANPAVAAALRSGNGRNLAAVLRDAAAELPWTECLAVYRPDGVAIAEWSRGRVLPRDVTRAGWRPSVRAPSPDATVDVVHPGGLPGLVVVGHVVPDGPRIAGTSAAVVWAAGIQSWLEDCAPPRVLVDVRDDHGDLIASSGPAAYRTLSGRMLDDGWSAVNSHCRVLVRMPEAEAIAQTQQLVSYLSILMIPIIAGFSVAAWHRLRMARQDRIIAESLAAQNAALRAADRARSDFLANVSHDLRTPLASMQVSISSLLDGPAPGGPEVSREVLAVLEREVHRLTGRVRNLLDMSRIEAGVDPPRMEPADLTEIAGVALERVAPLTAGRSIHADFPDVPLMVECDEEQIATVMVNLLENATKYAPEDLPLRLTGREARGMVEFRLRDHGPGVDPAETERIFEKFHRAGRPTRAHGTGLGLAIARAIVEAHGGRIGVDRPEGGGAEFWFTLPAMAHEMEAADA